MKKSHLPCDSTSACHRGQESQYGTLWLHQRSRHSGAVLPPRQRTKRICARKSEHANCLTRVYFRRKEEHLCLASLVRLSRAASVVGLQLSELHVMPLVGRASSHKIENFQWPTSTNAFSESSKFWFQVGKLWH